MREPLTRIFHTLSLGEVSVDAFFLLSGYLIAKSMDRSPSVWVYLERRILRIYPAFVVAYLISVFLLGSLLGAHPWEHAPKTMLRLAFLWDPMRYPNATSGVLIPPLNGSMWTIVYEFRCYLLIAGAGVIGVLRRPRVMAAVTVLGLSMSIISTFGGVHDSLERIGSHKIIFGIVGDPYQTIRLTSTFLVGSLFYIYQEAIFSRMNWWIATICAAISIALMYRDPHFAEFGVVTFGALALFWVAFRAQFGPIRRINDSWDISYGVYLYGWPIAIFLLWLSPSLSPGTLAILGLVLAMMVGACSWWGVEKWTKDIVVRRPDRLPPGRISTERTDAAVMAADPD